MSSDGQANPNRCDHRFFVELDKMRGEVTVAQLITEVAILRRVAREVLRECDQKGGLLSEAELVAKIRHYLAKQALLVEAG